MEWIKSKVGEYWDAKAPPYHICTRTRPLIPDERGGFVLFHGAAGEIGVFPSLAEAQNAAVKHHVHRGNSITLPTDAVFRLVRAARAACIHGERSDLEYAVTNTAFDGIE